MKALAMPWLILAAAAAATIAARAHAAPPMVPPAEALATLADTSAAQQIEIRKILIQRRDAHDAAHEHARSEMDALRTKERGEHERIDAQSSEQLRKLLGEEGYRHFAEWQLAQRPPMPRGPHEERGPPHGADGPRHGGPGGADAD